MQSVLIIALLVLLVAALAWGIHLQRRARSLRSQLRQAQKGQEAVLSLIDKLGEKITSKIDLDETLRIITEYIVQATQAESGAIFVINDGENTMQARVVLGPFPPLHRMHEEGVTGRTFGPERIRQDVIGIDEGLLGWVVREGEPLLVTDAEADPRFPRNAALLSQMNSLILCPLRVRGNPLGVFVVVNKRGAASFDSRDLALLQALADQAAVTVDLVKLYDVLAEQKRLEQELAIAHEFQRMLLPERFPSIDGYELFAMSEAATIVGGDYYDFFYVDDRHLGLVIADVSGKGIPGALIMAMVRAVLRAEARGSLSPKEVLKRVNERVLLDTRESVFITMIYGILNLERRTLRFVRAGHEPLLVVRPEGTGVRRLAPEGIALGLVGSDLFETSEELEIQLHEGELALFYTDGVVEAMDQSSEEYGRERLVARLQQLDHASAESLIQNVVEDIHQFTLGIPQHDDITMLALRVHRAGADRDSQEAMTRRTA